MEEMEERYVFHLTGNRFSLEGGVWKGPRRNRLVLIEQGLDRGLLREQLWVCLSELVRGE